MASYHDLLDAIARIRSVTGDPDAWKKGLTGDDVTIVCNPASPPAALGAVLAKLTAAHPEVFLAGSGDGPPAPPRVGEGAAAEAIRDAEAALAHQNTDAAHVDLQVVTAVLNAHAAHDEGLAELIALQRDVEEAVANRTDLDTPAGARQFQRFLIGKLRDIRNVVENSRLDATSKASLAAALASLYASSTPGPHDEPPVERPQSDPAPPESRHRHEAPAETARGAAPPPPPAPWDPGPDGYSGPDVLDPLMPELPWTDPPPAGTPAQAPPASAAGLPPAAMPAPVMPLPPMAAPSWPGGLPGSAPFGGGLPAFGSPLAPASPLPESPRQDFPEQAGAGRTAAEASAEPKPEPNSEPAEVADADPDNPPAPDAVATTVVLPDGDTITAPSPELAAAITAAVGGAAIPDAFRQQGITIPAPGSVITAPLDPGALTAGDIGLFVDRHALALGNGKALLDQQVQPIAGVSGPGFIGWQHPPVPETTNAAPDVPAPNRAAATAPS